MDIVNNLVLVFYFFPAVLVLFYAFNKYRKHNRSVKKLNERLAAKQDVPSSLHPDFDLSKCIGCGACVPACPEKIVIGLINRKPHIVDPSHCIGHGACRLACPVNAIKLVFGSKTRGVDIPFVSPSFETNIPGVFIAGELGGMGLVRNAITQGKQAMESIVKAKKKTRKDQYDVIIVGAGPAGLSSTLGAMKAKLNHLTIEQDSFGGTVAHFPRGKIVMTSTVNLPLVGKVNIGGEISKEDLLKKWIAIKKKYKVKVNTGERMEKLEMDPQGGFVISTTKGVYKTQAVLLTIGRRGTPRTLGVPGENKTKVVYRLEDPREYQGKHVLVVGGGDSALEAAHSISEEEGSTVTLSYRSASFSRAKPKNQDKINAAEQAKKITVLYKSNVKAIEDNRVVIEYQDKMHEVPNDVVIISAGGVLPTPMLKDLGIQVNTKYGEE